MDMATTASSHAAPSTTAANTTGETIVGWHIFRIDGFSKTKDLGVGQSIKSSTFRVGGHGWYVDCYPGGVDDVSASTDCVSLFMCRQEDPDDTASRLEIEGYCKSTLIESLQDGCVKKLAGYPTIVAPFADEGRHWLHGADFVLWEELEFLLKDDCFHVRCVVFVEKFPTAPPQDMAIETVAGSHVLTVDDSYCNTRRAFVVGEAIGSSKFCVGGHTWCFYFFPCSEDETREDNRVTVKLCLDDPGDKDEVKVRFEVSLLTRAGQKISATQDVSTFSERSNVYVCNFLITMEHESSPLLTDGIQIKCDIAVVNGITVTPMPNLHCGDLHGRQLVRVRGDVTFEVRGHLFPAHKCVLTTRCTAFMAKFCGPAGNENAAVTHRLRIDDMEPRVFEAFLHYIYTDTLPEVSDEDKVGMARELLVAADLYGMERLKLICGDLLCSYINDARSAVTTLDLADKHGCRKLKEACMKFLMHHFGNVAP